LTLLTFFSLFFYHQIDEQVLPERYQHHITKEINRILRDLDKPSESEQADQVRRSVWRRESDIRSELEDARQGLAMANEHLVDIEKRCETLEIQAIHSENKYRDAVRQLREQERALEASHHAYAGTASSVASSAHHSDSEEHHSQSTATTVVSPPGSPKQYATTNGTQFMDVPMSESMLSRSASLSPSEHDMDLKEKDAGALREALVSRILEGICHFCYADVFAIHQSITLT
jgi:WNK lysine deficient protein kinase